LLGKNTTQRYFTLHKSVIGRVYKSRLLCPDVCRSFNVFLSSVVI
jgi:hypothetical protein